MKLFLAVMMLLFAQASYAQAQDCTIQYLGVNEGAEEEGEPSVSVAGRDHIGIGMSERQEASHASTNTYRLFSLDTQRSASSSSPVLNVFLITCVTPE
jgi:hypothetical protein